MRLSVHGLGLSVRVEGREKTLLDPCAFHVDPGEIVGLTGPAGAGKSTLLRVMAGLEPRSGGEVRLEGEARELCELRRRVALLPQVLAAPRASTEELRRRAARFRTRPEGLPPERLEAELQALGVDPGRSAIPGDELSPAERRLQWLALLLAGRPAHLLLDDPVRELPSDARERLVSRLEAFRSGGGGVLLACASELLLARLCSRLMVIYDGTIQAEGTPLELIPAAVAELRRETRR